MASFKTAYLQREIPLDLVVVASEGETLKVGDLVTVIPETATVSAYMEKAASLDTATHIIAQSDMTLSQDFVQKQYQEYAYSPDVAPTANSVPTDKRGKWKHVALYLITDKTDIITAIDGSDHA